MNTGKGCNSFFLPSLNARVEAWTDATDDCTTVYEGIGQENNLNLRIEVETYMKRWRNKV